MNRIFLYHRIKSAVKTAEFVSDRMSYIVILNVHAQSKEKSDDSKHRFYEELDQVFLSYS
jgi:hypothetical protein